jgi:hypothetical protein
MIVGVELEDALANLSAPNPSCTPRSAGIAPSESVGHGSSVRKRLSAA